MATINNTLSTLYKKTTTSRHRQQLLLLQQLRQQQLQEQQHLQQLQLRGHSILLRMKKKNRNIDNLYFWLAWLFAAGLFRDRE